MNFAVIDNVVVCSNFIGLMVGICSLILYNAMNDLRRLNIMTSNVWASQTLVQRGTVKCFLPLLHWLSSSVLLKQGAKVFNSTLILFLVLRLTWLESYKISLCCGIDQLLHK